MGLIDPGLMEILVCPACRSALKEDEPASELACTSCGRRYPVRDGIAIMLLDDDNSSDGG